MPAGSYRSILPDIRRVVAVRLCGWAEQLQQKRAFLCDMELNISGKSADCGPTFYCTAAPSISGRLVLCVLTKMPPARPEAREDP
jgi:hypothetical protein